MSWASFRFYAELRDFLPDDKKSGYVRVKIPGHETVKHLVEALGIPHTEIDLLLVNGKSIDFDYLVAENDYISVYPMFETFDIQSVSKIRQEPLRIPKFINDTHLGKLADYLRLLGFDTLYRNDIQDDELAAISNAEDRIILTRDRGVLKRKIVTRGYLVRADLPQDQVVEVLRRFDLAAQAKPYSRCSLCNGVLEEVKKEDILEKLEPLTMKYFHQFKRCPQCDQVYWKGSHFDRMEEFISDVLDLSTKTNK
jgi:uncharacterized protein with PIN domain